MTDRWINVVLSVIVVVGLAAVTIYERPRAAQERAELLGQDVAELEERDGDESPADVDLSEVVDEADPRQQALEGHGVSASHPVAVEVGMAILEAGGNAVDAAVAVSYALGVVEPFGSGPGGGGAMLVHELDGDPTAYDYREVAPDSGELPASDIGVPGFVAGMEHIHDEHGSMDLDALIEPAVRYAADGVEVTDYVHERLVGAAHRLPLNQLPAFFPDGEAIEAGETLVQPEYADALRAIQEDGATAFYEGELADGIADEVTGLEPDDLAGYEVLEVEPAVGRFAGVDVIGGGAPTSGATLVSQLQIAEALDVGDHAPDSPGAVHRRAQAYRLALSDRGEHLSDPSVEDVPLDDLLDVERADELADQVPSDGFVEVDDLDADIDPETDTTHLVVVDQEGTMVSATNTLSNFFGSGLPVSGFFLNDQLKNFSSDPDSINSPAPGKRPRSFVTPTIVADDGKPLLGIGSPGGRRIPLTIAQVIERWAGRGHTLSDATAAPRIHLEDRELYFEEDPDGDTVDALSDAGYEIVRDEPTNVFYGAVQALRIDHDAGTVHGIADDRRDGAWASNEQ